MKKILRFLLLGVSVLGIILIYNALQLKSSQPQVAAVAHFEVGQKSLDNLSKAIQFPTISFENKEDFDSIPFLNFISFLEETYPLADSLLKKETVNKYSLLYEWKGKNPTLKPLILMGHIDVVPIEESTKNQWQQPPFSGAIKDNFIWGRGAIDDKINVIGTLEAVEKLLNEGYQPQRTIYLAFGHDEEIGGRKGAVEIVNLLKERKVEAEMVIDEGGVIMEGKVPGIAPPVALIGTAEKGFVTLELVVNIAGGHSSMPEKETTIDILSAAIVKLRKNQFPTRIAPPVKDFMNTVGAEMPFAQKVIFANLWLFEPLVLNLYTETNTGNAMVRTTTTFTIFNSGFKDNVIPSEGKAKINFRILQGETTKTVIDRVIQIIDDGRITVKIGSNFNTEPSPVSEINTPAFEVLTKTIKQKFPEVVITPYLVIGGTDSRFYKEISKNVYRFIPIKNPIGFHGIDERIDIPSYKNAINFYYQLIKNVNE